MHKLASIATTAVAGLILASPVAAQSEAPNPSEMDGFVSGYARSYANPDVTVDEPTEEGVVTSASVYILTYEEDDQAAEAFDMMSEQATAQTDESAGTMDINEVDDLGDQAISGVFTPAESEDAAEADASDEASLGDVTLNMPLTTILAVQDDENVYLFNATGVDDVDALSDLAEEVMDEGVSDDDVEFNEDGTSTGGAYDAIEAGEDTDILDGLEPMHDMDLSESF